MPSALTLLVERLRQFFDWWFRELADCVPLRLRELIGAGAQRLVILIADKTVTFEHVKGKTVLWLGSLDLSQSSPAGQRETVREIVSDAKLRSAQVVICLPRGSALRRIVELPSPALENLREVLSFEMDRHTPFESDEVYFDYHVTQHDTENKLVKIDIVVMARELADRAIALVTGWGLEPDRLSLADRQEDEHEFNLLPRSTTRPARSKSFKLSVVMGATACFLLGIWIYMPLRDKQAYLADLEARLAKARAEASQASELTDRVSEMADRSRFVMAQKRDRFAVMDMLNEVTRLLPDDTWVLQFGRRGDQTVRPPAGRME